MFIDTHAHLFYPDFKNDLSDIIKRAKDSSVDFIIVPGSDLITSHQAIQLAREYDMIYAAIGIHPHETAHFNEEQITLLEKLLTNEKIVAIGEIGLDYYYDFSPKDKQITAFKKQIDLAIKHNLPIIVHNRLASDDLFKILEEYKNDKPKAQFHCFSGTINEAKKIIEMRDYVSFTANLTYKKADSLREIASKISVEDLLLETDSPFMAPQNFRGKRNEPSYIKYLAEELARLQNLRIEDIARTTSYNAYKLYGIGKMPETSYVYQIGDSLYINVTNRCNADCVFCSRKDDPVIAGYNLKMSKSEEPDAEKYIQLIGDPKKYKEIVFCGYGEPTIRWDVVKKIAAYVKANGGKTRLNTNGHGNFINKRDITEDFPGLIDTVSVSLNSVDRNEYAKLMNVDPSLHEEMIEFARKAKSKCKVIMTIVGMSQIDEEKAKKFAVEELGVDFRTRVYF